LHNASEEDDQNPKIWNALGVALSKSGDLESADVCFENAVMLDPGNLTYERNLGKNQDKNVHNNPNEQKNQKKLIPRYDGNYFYLIILFFIPPIICYYNIGLGFFTLLFSAYLIYLDAKSIHAGIDPYVTGVPSWPARDWGIIAFLFWIAVPYYIFKRKEIFDGNIDYYLKLNQVFEKQGSFIGAIIKIFGILAILCLISVFVAAFIFGIPTSSSTNIIKGTVPTVSSGSTNNLLVPSAPEETWYSSRDLLIRDISRSGNFDQLFRDTYNSGNLIEASSIISEWYNVVTTERASILLLIVPSEKVEFKKIAEQQLKLEEDLISYANKVIKKEMNYSDYERISKEYAEVREMAINIIYKS